MNDFENDLYRLIKKTNYSLNFQLKTRTCDSIAKRSLRLKKTARQRKKF